MKNVITLFEGGLMGLVEILPGVSGSTIALVMGIYDDFVNLLYDISVFARMLVMALIRVETFDAVKKSFWKIDLRFGLFLAVGMALAVAFFSGVITDLLDRYPQYMSAFFFGLVLASIWIPWREMKERTMTLYFLMIISFILTFVLLGLNGAGANNDPGIIFLFFGGIVGISGMILPGVSGSFILLILGIYDYAIELIHDAFTLSLEGDQIVKLFAFVLGQVVGFLVFVRILKVSLKYYRPQVMAIIVGIMAGSLRALWPFFITLGEGDTAVRDYINLWDVYPTDLAIVIISLLFGAGFVFIVNFLSSDKEQINDI